MLIITHPQKPECQTSVYMVLRSCSRERNGEHYSGYRLVEWGFEDNVAPHNLEMLESFFVQEALKEYAETHPTLLQNNKEIFHPLVEYFLPQ